ncbi:uncharacterized protein Gasu_10310 [Galdieria sulphuraria]|uniref:Haem-binding uptake Tiki superfamily ChaN domain-containing protein n=1 Tax=Galdieria sulphuraria TaxID=130081 RepID=M2X580_GALSU|nr:uncharacterized protein Gasu_10310 [Galdieria sulphuraria]EME31645.1 hypothetical protein Gasu_10310 [Galdieria sulphuraria]|eukprot:XP_005708165.1 hypothetical protein Gasu_10310 [Galdieria sulphuraria]
MSIHKLFLKKDFVFQAFKQSVYYGQKLSWSTNPVRAAFPKSSTFIKSKGLYPVREPAFANYNEWLSKRTFVTNWNRYFISAVASVSLVGALYVVSMSSKTIPDAVALNGTEKLAPTAVIERQQDNSKIANTSLISNLFQIYDDKGKKTDLNALFTSFNNREVILIGETHDDSVAHELELAIVQHLFQRQYSEKDRKPLIVSLEFFNYDMQSYLDSYIEKKLSEAEFLESCVQQPGNIEDYLPLLRFCREKHIPILASNAPGHIIEMVRKDGKEYLRNLKDEDIFGIPPLPYPEPSASYEAKFMALMNHQLMLAAHGMWKDDIYSLRQNENFQRRLNNYLEAQNLWDASMAYHIVNKIEENPKVTVCHICGKFHMEGGLGIPEHLHNYAPHLNVVSVTIIPEESLTTEECKNGNGFVIRTSTLESDK